MTHFAREYGNAIFELALEESIADQVSDQLKMLQQCFQENPDYIRLLCARAVDLDARIGMIDQVFRDQLHPYVLNFLKILTGRGAMDHFDECAQVFRMRFNESFGYAEAVVTSAAALNEEQIEALRQKLAAMAGKKIIIHTKINPDLIGGMQVDLEGKRYDNSIRTRLDGMRRTLTERE